MKSFQVASKAKGRSALLTRLNRISQRYGFTSTQIDHALQHFSNELRKYDCGATFPITAVTLNRHSNIIKKYLDTNIEFAVHGYTHVDYSQLSPEAQTLSLQLARQVFSNIGLHPKGFRSPYLSRNSTLNSSLHEARFLYVSNQPILWNVLDDDSLARSIKTSYERALAFYNPWQICDRLSLPWFDDQLVEIPISLPDDEILIDRLYNLDNIVDKTWLRMFTLSYQNGELFTLQLHPERINLCIAGLTAVLQKARALTPKVWCARLDEIAAWWKARYKASIDISGNNVEGYNCVVSGPGDITVLARGVETDVPGISWANGYQQVESMRFTAYSSTRPFIGTSASTPLKLVEFLKQQGYIVEYSEDRESHSYYFDQVSFDDKQERKVVDQIEKTNQPLIRFGRWPGGAQSALCITGDIDAITLWDYGLRIFGK